MKQQWTIGSILNWTKQYFSEKGVDNPRLDAEVLLCHVLKLDRLHLYVQFDRPLNREELARFRELVKLRAQRIPVAYILGVKEFMGLAFKVTPATLIPRPDTEILVEWVLGRLPAASQAAILDVGTGSGAIIISILTKRPYCHGTGVDISAAAIAVARENARQLGVADRLTFRTGNLFAPVAGQQFDVIVSNPPYIPTAALATLAPEVQREPRQALVGGVDGLDFYRQIIAQAPKYLRPGGLLALEIGIGQAGPVAALARQTDNGLQLVAIEKDYAGIERVIAFSLADREADK